MRTTKQDCDEDSFERTEVSVWKASESRNGVQKVSEDTFPEAPPKESTQEGANNTKHGIRSAEGDERTVQSR